MADFDDYESEERSRPSDPHEERAVAVLRKFFNERREHVFTSRQVEVYHEKQFFHWVTNRAVRDLVEEGLMRSEMRELDFGGSVKLLWHRSYRYFRRDAVKLLGLVEEYSAPNIGGALGLHGELMVLEGFARHQFVMLGREVKSLKGIEWTKTEHDLDFVFERDSLSYGVEVENTLAYMDYSELKTKVSMCAYLNVRPVIVARMLPKTWVEELRVAGGFALLLGFQLYPLAHKALARKVRDLMGLPVDAPRALESGTMARFMAWHNQQIPSL